MNQLYSQNTDMLEQTKTNTKREWKCEKDCMKLKQFILDIQQVTANRQKKENWLIIMIFINALVLANL